VKFAYDIKSCRPACVLLQAVMAGPEASAAVLKFPNETWIIDGPSVKDLKVYETSLLELKQLLLITEKKHGLTPVGI
jgi:hypothetical protein